MQKPGPDLPHGIVLGSRAQMVKLFLVFTYVWQEDVAKITQVPGGNAQCKSGLEITWLESVTI